MAALLVNPRKRRATKRRTRRAAPRRKTSLATVKTTSVRRYRRNPSPRGLMTTVKEGAIGATGAIAAEFLLSKLPLPEQFKSGTMQPVAAALASVGVGMLVSKFGKKPALGKAMAQGGVTVALHQSLRGFVSAPLGLQSSTMAYYGSDFNDMGYVEPTDVFDDDDSDLMGYFENDM